MLFMTKNILLSLIIVCGVSACGYYLFSDKKEAPVISALIGDFKINTQETQNQNPATSTEVVGDAQVATVNSAINNKKTHMITIDTNYGKIVIETYDADAPNTVKNFVTLAEKGFYNGLTFHRVIKGFMIQGGDPNGNGTGGPGYKFDDELNPNTPSYKAGYKKGVVAMANAGPNTNGSQFFIMNEDYPLPNAYTIFGKVVSGQDIVDKIALVKTGANDKPVSPVVMNKVVVN